ncbi:MAG: hypothetical protein M1170_02380 [Patescibacteria group bacterium]|nr:hypothetical protein [Patescibacteria group bacterium]
MEYQGGKSIWQEAEKQLSVRLKEQFENLGSDDVKSAEALKTYNIDRMKDAIVNAIQNNDEALMGKYNLSGIDPDHITAEQLKNINWDKAFEDVFSENKLTAELEPGQIESITKNNATLRQFFSEHSRAPRTIENYEAILKGKGVTGELPSELPTGPKPIKVPPEYFDGSKKMLYKEQLDELNEKYPAKEIPFSNVQNWLEDKAKIDVEKSSWLNEKSLERLKIKDVIDSGFAKPQGVEAYTTAAPEWGSSQWWEMKEKTELQEKIGKILRAMSSEERIKFQNNSVLDFLKNYLKTGGK